MDGSEVDIDSRINRTSRRLQQLKKLKKDPTTSNETNSNLKDLYTQSNSPKKPKAIRRLSSNLMEPDDSDLPQDSKYSSSSPISKKRFDLIRDILESTGRGCSSAVHYERKKNHRSTGMWSTHFSTNQGASCKLELKRSVLHNRKRPKGRITISVAPGVQGTPTGCEILTSKHPNFGFSLVKQWDIGRPIAEGIYQDLSLEEDKILPFVSLNFFGIHEKFKSHRVLGLNIYLDIEEGLPGTPPKEEPNRKSNSQNKVPSNPTDRSKSIQKKSSAFSSSMLGKLYHQTDEPFETEPDPSPEYNAFNPIEDEETNENDDNNHEEKVSKRSQNSYSNIHLGEEPKYEKEETENSFPVHQKTPLPPNKTKRLAENRKSRESLVRDYHRAKKRQKKSSLGHKPVSKKRKKKPSKRKTPKKDKKKKGKLTEENLNQYNGGDQKFFGNIPRWYNNEELSEIQTIDYSMLDQETPLMIPIDKSYNSPSKETIISDQKWLDLVNRVSNYKTPPENMKKLNRSDDDVLKFEFEVPISESEENESASGYSLSPTEISEGGSQEEDKEEDNIEEEIVEGEEEDYDTIQESSIKGDTESELSDDFPFKSEIDEKIKQKDNVSKTTSLGHSRMFSQLYISENENVSGNETKPEHSSIADHENNVPEETSENVGNDYVGLTKSKNKEGTDTRVEEEFYQENDEESDGDDKCYKKGAEFEEYSKIGKEISLNEDQPMFEKKETEDDSETAKSMLKQKKERMRKQLEEFEQNSNHQRDIQENSDNHDETIRNGVL
eukprot:gb/GECH01008253.1/.p1 GENE.gb/GECH01008253.1/~~gb/GECH01008253.1/.p1  ORF type:complete len:778 (+),score=194.57 gb/GECH01008253.1/:1-2334(+)